MAEQSVQPVFKAGLGNLLNRFRDTVDQIPRTKTQLLRRADGSKPQSSIVGEDGKIVDQRPLWRLAEQDNKAEDLAGDQIIKGEVQLFDENGNPMKPEQANDGSSDDIEKDKDPYASDSLLANLLRNMKTSSEAYGKAREDQVASQGWPSMYNTEAPTGSGLNGDQEAINAMNAAESEQQKRLSELTQDDYFKVANEVLLNSGLGGNFTSLSDFINNSDRAALKQFMTDERIKPFYEGSYEKYNGFATDDDFNRFYDDSHAVTVEDMYRDKNLMADHLGSSGEAIQDAMKYFMSPKGGGWMYGIPDNWDLSTVTSDQMLDMMTYEVLPLIANALSDRGIRGEAFLKLFHPDEINRLMGMDTYTFGLEGMEGDLGTIADQGKTQRIRPDTSFNNFAFDAYGVPYAGAADALYDASDNLLHVAQKPMQDEKNQNSNAAGTADASAAAQDQYNQRNEG